MIQNYDDALAFIHGRHKWKKTNTFARIQDLLAELGNPQNNLKYVHVTGTNGKGSVSKMTAQILEESGLKVGLFTSPFIMRFNERMQINGEPIPDADLTRIMQRIEPILDKMDATLVEGGPTEFETLTALMFVYFVEQYVDVAVLEVGIGGTWDTTNVIDDKLVSVITTIGYDHQHVLGDTLAEIAEAKAGIIMPERPTVIGKLPAQAREVIAQKADELVELGNDFAVKNVVVDPKWGLRFDFNNDDVTFAEVDLDLMGEFQADNAAIAIEVAQIVLPKFGKNLEINVLAAALKKVQWPARFEKLGDEPLVVIDGAHNPAGILALTDTLKRDFKGKYIHIIMGVLADKNYQLMIEELLTVKNAELSVVGFNSPMNRENLDPHAITDLLPGKHIATFDTWQDGLAHILQQMDVSDDMLVITGSLYFVSEVRNTLLAGEN